MVLGASLYWKVVLEFWFGHPKCHFWYPQNGKNRPFGPFWGYQKWHFGCPNQNSETTFRDPNHPQNPHLDTLGTFFGPRKVFFFAILSILHIFGSFIEGKNFKCKSRNEDGLKSKNARKQTGFKIQFYIGIDLSRNFFRFIFLSPYPNGYRKEMWNGILRTHWQRMVCTGW